MLLEKPHIFQNKTLSIYKSYLFRILNVDPVDCEWSDWTNSPCSKSCGGGQIIKKRQKIKEEVDTTCYGEPMAFEDCNTAKCEDKYNHILLHKNKSVLPN